MEFDKVRLAKRSILLIALIAVLVLAMFAGTALAQKNAKNVIVMISDGAGYNMFLAADYYQHGEYGHQVYESFPYQYAMSHYPAGGGYDPLGFWTDWTYQLGWGLYQVTESNMSATAMGTGIKCIGGLGIDRNGNRTKNIVEIAEGRGRATGVVSTQSFAEATPAGFSAHVADRKMLKQIIEQQLRESGLDVVMGPHHPYYDMNGDYHETGDFDPANKLLWNEATWNALVAGEIGNDADGDGAVEYWTLIEERADFQALMTGDTPERVAGVVQNGGGAKQGGGYTQFYRTGAAGDAPFTVPLLENSPTLTEMSLAAINVLDNDPDGFFLMIEGANVDYGNHLGWLGRAIEEQIDFNDAVEAVVDWIETNSSWDETLLIITSDHETGGIYGPDSGTGTPSEPGDPAVYKPIVNNGVGQVPGHAYYNHRWEYGPDFYWHTNALVPLYAKGVNANYLHGLADGMDPVYGLYLDNTDIFRIVELSIR